MAAAGGAAAAYAGGQPGAPPYVRAHTAKHRIRADFE